MPDKTVSRVVVYSIQNNGDIDESIYTDTSPVDALINEYICYSGKHTAIDMHEPRIRSALREKVREGSSGKTLILGNFCVILGGSNVRPH